MKVYIVSYDLNSRANPDYEGVCTALSACGDVKRLHQSVFLLASNLGAMTIRESIKPTLNPGDSVFIALFDLSEWSGWNTRMSAWIAEHSN